jgi:hypothetical protein
MRWVSPKNLVLVVVWELRAGVGTNCEEKRLFPNSFDHGPDDLIGSPRKRPTKGQMTNWESL